MAFSAEETYFAVLRSALWRTALPDDMDGVPFAEVLLLAQHQGTGALVAERLLSCGSLPEEMRMRCKAVCARGMMAQEEQRAVLRTSLKALESGGITPVLLKGLGLAHYYPKPYLRNCGDVDIYVGKEHYHTGAKLLRETFPDVPRFETEEEYFKHYNLNVGTTAVEMHRVTKIFMHPKDDKLYDALEREALQKKYVHYACGEDEWNEPEGRFNVLFVFVHSWEHYVTESANIRQLCDLALLVSHHQDGLEEYLRENLTKLHLRHAWELYAYLMVKYIGLPKAQCPLYTESCAARAEQLLADILGGRELCPAPEHPAPKNVILRKLYTLRQRIATAREIGKVEPHYARHMVVTAFAQSWERFKKGENTRKWE